MNSIKTYILVALSCLSLSGCITTTALYGAKFEPVENTIDTYTLAIAFGGTNFDTRTVEAATRKDLVAEARKLLSTNKSYSGYKIIDFKKIQSPFSKVIYTVKFARKK